MVDNNTFFHGEWTRTEEVLKVAVCVTKQRATASVSGSSLNSKHWR